jgi:hypothetical protein
MLSPSCLDSLVYLTADSTMHIPVMIMRHALPHHMIILTISGYRDICRTDIVPRHRKNTKVDLVLLGLLVLLADFLEIECCEKAMR